MARWGNVFIAATAVDFPPAIPVSRAVANGDYPAKLAERTEQRSVTVAPADEPPGAFAARAARSALANSGYDFDDVGLFVHTSVLDPSPRMSNPASWLERELGRGGFRDVAQLMNGCDGVMTGLRWAAAHLSCDDENPAALISAAESWQPAEVIDRWTVDPDAPFGDGGAALVLAKDHGTARLLAATTYTQPSLEGVHRGPRVFGHGASLPVTLTDRSRAFYTTSAISREEAWKMRGTGIRVVIERVLAHAGIERKRISRVVLPFKGRQVLDQEYLPYLDKLEPAQSSIERGLEIGHLGGADPIASFHFATTSGELTSGDLAIIYSEGVGIVQSAALVEIV
ncbi:hypothetical protein [Actinokineospora diospyrosa]|uniref:3-oxoacyl-[acyl-carrier-protein] synthase-3 n=1 Tax=Actinokineospora diospyrosa TaxID=103728 RepID=A0ABT1I5Q1_9PSEU|nr:hypothetical protein [Actinokineospora diospyrosa]MCP2267907.1 3-oxoacyl-[acyl-carrier-protein] synthase-3 [Actinokineospora diospyrosa]